MPRIMVTKKDGETGKSWEDIKKDIENSGGKVVDEFTLTRTYLVDMPDDKLSAFESNEHYTVEADKEVTTQV